MIPDRATQIAARIDGDAKPRRSHFLKYFVAVSCRYQALLSDRQHACSDGKRLVTDGGAVAPEVDLEGNVATVDLFVDGEFRCWEGKAGWRGFVREGDTYYWVDTRLDEGDWARKLRVGEWAVEATIRAWLAGETDCAPGDWRRGVEPAAEARP